MKPDLPRVLAVTGSPKLLNLKNSAVVSADHYLRGELPVVTAEPIVLNLCRSLGYLSRGYYVSLLAEGRGHEVVPTVQVLEAAANPISFLRTLDAAGVPTASPRRFRRMAKETEPVLVAMHTGESDEPRAFQAQAQGNSDVHLRPHEGEIASILVVLGKTTDARFRTLAAKVYREFPLPVFQLRLVRDRTWKVCGINLSAIAKLDESHMELLDEAIAELARTPEVRPVRSKARPSIACLWDPEDPTSPSTRETLDRFAAAAMRLGANFNILTRHETHRLAEHDALFVRTLTGLDRWPFPVQQRAAQLKMPVIDDPQSTIRCSNKVYLFELLHRLGIPQPKAHVVTPGMGIEAVADLGFPLIVKQPDGSFSLAVKKARDEVEYRDVTGRFFKRSPLLLVQEYLPSEFDWRIGVLAGRVLFACKYYMAKGHWQILKNDGKGTPGESGRVVAVPRESLDPRVAEVAVAAARSVGGGLYGVDLKETPRGPVVIEVNDNPNIDEGYEDEAEKSRLYEEVIQWFIDRIREEAVDEAREASRT